MQSRIKVFESIFYRFWDIRRFSNGMPLKSGLGVTRPVNLCTICTSVGLCLSLIECVYLLRMQWAQEKYTVNRNLLRYGLSRAFKVIEISTNRKPMRLRFFHYNYILSFPRYIDLLVENFRFFAVFTYPSLVLSRVTQICLSVCPSLPDVPVKDENGLTYRHSFFSPYGSPLVLLASNIFTKLRGHPPRGR